MTLGAHWASDGCTASAAASFAAIARGFQAFAADGSELGPGGLQIGAERRLGVQSSHGGGGH